MTETPAQPTPPATRLVLFDIDGTLLRGDGSGRHAMEHALTRVFGVPGDPSYHYDGKTDRQIVRELMRREGHDDAAIDGRLTEVVSHYVERLRADVSAGMRSIVRLAGVAELLDALEQRAEVVLGLLTGNVAEGASVKLEAAGIDMRRFRANAFGSDHENRPRLPEIARRRAGELLGTEPDGASIVVIGDTPADIDCARSVGARTVAVATGRYSVDDLAGHGPSVVLPDFRDTAAAVDAIMGPPSA